uniref:Uncharacterized protein n=1 Tax=Felis catus TaxID=9685 RepID=A0ABI7ZFS5_FELCA
MHSWWNVNWCSHSGIQYRGSSKKLKIELPCDPVIILLGIYLKKIKTLIRKDICISMFIVALFTIAKIQKQPKCQLIDKWINMMWCIYLQWSTTQTRKITKS